MALTPMHGELARLAPIASGRWMLVVRYSHPRARLTRRSLDLPRMGGADDEVWFELPVSQSADQNTHAADVVEVLTDTSTRLQTIELPHSHPSVETKPAIRQMVEFHVDRCNEILFPSRGGGTGAPLRVAKWTRTDWDHARAVYWQPEDEEGPLHIIVRIAEECDPILERVCQRPRRMLRRVREMSRFERVQQLDDSCIRWLIRQPGRTVLQKAGPQRKVLAVQRIETADTPENRVIRDFLERAKNACRAYLDRHGHRRQSERVKIVERFRRRLNRWLTASELASVPRLVGVPQANYVLQFDERYAPLWFWYDRLRRQQIGADEAWLWQRRVLVEHCQLAFADTLSRIEIRPAFAKRLYMTMDHDCGWFAADQSVLNPWLIGDGSQIVYMVRSDAIEEASAALRLPRDLGRVGADLLVARVCFGVDGAAPVVALIYVDFARAGVNPSELSRVARDQSRLLDELRIPESIPIVQLLCGASTINAIRINERMSASGRRCIGADLPLPLSAETCDLSAILRHSGVLEEPDSVVQ